MLAILLESGSITMHLLDQHKGLVPLNFWLGLHSMWVFLSYWLHWCCGLDKRSTKFNNWKRTEQRKNLGFHFLYRKFQANKEHGQRDLKYASSLHLFFKKCSCSKIPFIINTDAKLERPWRANNLQSCLSYKQWHGQLLLYKFSGAFILFSFLKRR